MRENMPGWLILLIFILMNFISLTQIYQSTQITQIKDELMALQGCEIHD